MSETQDGSVAVIIPAYNAEKFIERALDSVMKQTYPPAEIFVVDDGSTDRTIEIIRQKYPAVTLIQQTRGGPAKARNAAMRLAKSELVAYLDADDWWEAEKLERQVAALRQHPEAVLNYTSLKMVREADGSVELKLRPADEELWPALRWGNPLIVPASVLARRAAAQAAGGFDERLKGNEDWYLWFKMRQLGPFCVCPEPLTMYRVSPGGLSGNADHMFNDFQQMLDDVLLADMTGMKRAVWRRKIMAHQAFRASMTARGAGDSVRERRYMFRSLLEWPMPWWTPERFKAGAVTVWRWLRGPERSVDLEK